MIVMKRWWLRIGAGIAATCMLLAVTPFAASYLMRTKFSPQAPVAKFRSPSSEIQAQQQDLIHFERLIALDRSFSAAARREAQARLAGMRSARNALDPAFFRVALQQIAALADNGHTRVYPGPEGRFPVIPLRVFPFADGLYVLRAKAESADLLGTRVVRIDGHPVSEVLQALKQLQGGTDALRELQTYGHVFTPRLLHALGLANDPERVTYVFEGSTGASLERTLSGAPAAEPGPDHGYALLGSDRPEYERVGWKALAAENGKPVAFREFNRVFRRFRDGDSCILTLQLKSNHDSGGERIADFLKESEAEMRRRSVCALILDMRYNGGGDYSQTAAFAKRLPQLVAPQAQVYILTSGQTFSAGITTVAFVKEAFGERAAIFGEPVGDRLQFWAEGGTACLPNAKLCFRYSTGMHDYAKPCRDWDKCFWLNWLYPVRVASLEPDERISLDFGDYLAGRDPVYERAVAVARMSASQPGS
jgi:hypothetical protein